MEDQKQRVYDALNKMGIKYEVGRTRARAYNGGYGPAGTPGKRNIV